MKTWKLSVSIDPFEGWHSDLLIAALATAGFEGFVETGNGFEAYITGKDQDPTHAAAILEEESRGRKINSRLEAMENRNWNEIWEKNFFLPVVVGGLVVVRAPFHREFPAVPFEIIIDPGMAFGTGHHETTSLVMESMADMEMLGKEVLDMGCGTGILAIWASKLGAAAVLAVDTDPWAAKAARRNCRVNNTPVVKVRRGDIRLPGKARFDLIVANIQKNIILTDLCRYASYLRPGGRLVVSGFFAEDIPAVEEEARKWALETAGNRSRNRWALVEFIKPPAW